MSTFSPSRKRNVAFEQARPPAPAKVGIVNAAIISTETRHRFKQAKRSTAEEHKFAQARMAVAAHHDHVGGRIRRMGRMVDGTSMSGDVMRLTSTLRTMPREVLAEVGARHSFALAGLVERRSPPQPALPFSTAARRRRRRAWQRRPPSQQIIMRSSFSRAFAG